MANKYTKTKVDIKKVIQLYESGMTQAEVAEEMGLTQKIIWARLKEVGYICRVAKKRDQAREKNSSWKGSNVGYSAFHFRIRALRGRPKKCEQCKTTDIKKTYDWANLTGKFDDPKDYKRLCRSCHFKMDKVILNIKHMRRRLPDE